MSEYCPFCGLDPFHRVDVGFGGPGVPVAVDCCEAGVGLYRNEKPAMQALEFMRSQSPRKKARAKKILTEVYGQ
jgi:hypothetical protein